MKHWLFALFFGTALAQTPPTPLQNGGTGANLSGTGGPNLFVKQASTGAPFTVVQPDASNLSNGTTGTGAVVLASAISGFGTGNVSNTGTPTTGQVAVWADATHIGGSAVTGAGLVVAQTSPTITSPTVTGAFTATGLVTNADLVSPTVTVNGTTCTLGSTCSPSGAGGITAVSVASANGFAGSSSGGATPAITITTSITGVLKGNGTAVSQAACADLSNGATGCSTATGTSGATIPLNNGNNTESGNNTYSGVSTFTGSIAVPTRVITGAGAITVSATTDYFICVNKSSGAATTVNLPASPATGLTMLIKDCKGDAATNNITITPNAGNIDGAGTYVMSTNRASVAVTYTGSEWSIN
jgi:hypothetical protein